MATYMRMAHDPYLVRAELMSNMSNDLKVEYMNVKKNRTVEQLYELIALK